MPFEGVSPFAGDTQASALCTVASLRRADGRCPRTRQHRRLVLSYRRYQPSATLQRCPQSCFGAQQLLFTLARMKLPILLLALPQAVRGTVATLTMYAVRILPLHAQLGGLDGFRRGWRQQSRSYVRQASLRMATAGRVTSKDMHGTYYYLEVRGFCTTLSNDGGRR